MQPIICMYIVICCTYSMFVLGTSLLRTPCDLKFSPYNRGFLNSEVFSGNREVPLYVLRYCTTVCGPSTMAMPLLFEQDFLD